jgi:hypothetical protein
MTGLADRVQILTPAQATFMREHMNRYSPMQTTAVGNFRLPFASRAAGFDLHAELRARQGTFIEIGGPTSSGFGVLDGQSPPQRVFVGNITPGMVIFRQNGSMALEGRVDFVANGTELPFANDSIGCFFASCLPLSVRKETLSEAMRVLEPGGLLIWQGTFHEDLAVIRELGFKVVQVSPEHNNTLVLQKIQTKVAPLPEMAQQAA